VQEDERKRISRELHDDLLQTLAAIRIELGFIGGRLATDAVGVASSLTVADELAAAAIVATRRIVNDLRPQSLEDLGLVAALEVLAEHFGQRTGVACHVEAQVEAAGEALQTPATANCLYRVAQEALNNVARHARASAVQVSLELTAEGRVVLRVSDDGCGMSADERRKPHAFGLLGMQERVRAIGGQLLVDGQRGGGTTVEVIVAPAAPGPVQSGNAPGEDVKLVHDPA